MARLENAQIDEPTEKVLPMIDPEADATVTPGVVKKRPFVLEMKRGAGGGNMPLMLIVLGAIILFGIGMLAFLSTKGSTKKKTAAEAAKPSLGRVAGTAAPGDLIPSDRVKPSADEAATSGAVDAADIEKTKAPKIAQSEAVKAQPTTPNGSKRLNQVGRFEEPNTTPGSPSKWTPAPYAGGQGEQQALKKEEDALSQPSLVFVAHTQNNGGLQQANRTLHQSNDNLGLAPGYHIAARLESMATTAVHAPVTAVVEYNYEHDGTVLIPAGSRVVGKIVQADPSGIVNIAFSSIEFPGGDPQSIDAVAADMNLQAIKGKVTGKQDGKKFLARSVSDIGETLAMVLGQSNTSGAISEDDLLRMRVADNIGNAGDQQVMQMMTMEHIVVSVPAGTEIYVIFERSQQADTASTQRTIQAPHSDGFAPAASTTAQP